MIIKKSKLFDRTIVKRKLPLNLSSINKIYFLHEIERKFQPVHLYYLKDVNVSPEGIVFKNLKVFEPCLINIADKKDFGVRYFLSNFIKRRKIKLTNNENYILAFDYWSNGYFHWMTDVLPRLLSIRHLYDKYILLLPENYQAHFILSTLEVFQINSLYRIPTNSYIKVKKLIMPGHIAGPGNYNEEIMKKIRGIFYNYFSESLTNIGEKIYVSRRKAKYRKIINEEEVVDLLEKYGFKEIYFEDFTLAEQVCIARNARVLISIHGGNLTNIMFMKPGSFVLEFRKLGDDHNNAYFSLASAMDVNYLYQFCDFEIGKKGPNPFNLWVDLKQLKKNVEMKL